MVVQHGVGEIVYYARFPRNVKRNKENKIAGNVDIGIITSVHKDGISNIYDVMDENGHVYSTHRVFGTYNETLEAFRQK